MQWTEIQKIIQQSRLLQSAAHENLLRAEELCEISQDVLYRTADFQEFLQESLLEAKGRYDARHDASLGIADLAR